jgi:hypothetical protein
MDDICRYCIYTVYFICKDSLCWLTGCVKLAREIYFRSEQKHVQQSVSRSQHTVRAASQGDLFPFRATIFSLGQTLYTPLCAGLRRVPGVLRFKNSQRNLYLT